MTDTEREIDPAPSECKKGKPYVNADIHDGAEKVGTEGGHWKGDVWVPERYRCADCGREWDV